MRTSVFWPYLLLPTSHPTSKSNCEQHWGPQSGTTTLNDEGGLFAILRPKSLHSESNAASWICVSRPRTIHFDRTVHCHSAKGNLCRKYATGCAHFSEGRLACAVTQLAQGARSDLRPQDRQVRLYYLRITRPSGRDVFSFLVETPRAWHCAIFGLLLWLAFLQRYCIAKNWSLSQHGDIDTSKTSSAGRLMSPFVRGCVLCIRGQGGGRGGIPIGWLSP